MYRSSRQADRFPLCPNGTLFAPRLKTFSRVLRSIMKKWFFLLLGLLYPVQASAAPDLSEIVVTATVLPSQVATVSSDVQIITSRELRDSGARTVTEALSRFVPSNGKIQPGAYSSVGLRGFNSLSSVSSVLGDSVIILLDGTRLATGNPDAIPFTIVDHIEIVRGPSSVLYGSSAMGGVVNIITKRGKDGMKGSVGLSFGSFDTAKAYAAASGSLNENWGAAFGVSGMKSRDYKTGSGEVYKNTRNANADIGFTVTGDLEKAGEIHVVGAYKNIFDTGTPGSESWLTPSDTVALSYAHLSASYRNTLDCGIDLAAAVYGDENRYVYGDAWSGDSRYKNTTIGIKSTISKHTDRFGTFSLGADISRFKEKAYGDAVYQPDLSGYTLGIFAEHKMDIGPLSLTEGARYDYNRSTVHKGMLADSIRGSKSFSHFSWALGATYWLNDNIGLKANLGTSFVAPTAVKLAGNYSDGWSRYIGNPDLKAEKGLTWQIGAEAEYMGLHAELMYFRTHYRDRISQILLPTWDYSWYNAESQDIAGFDLRVNKTFAITDDLALGAYANAEYFTTRKNHDRTLVNYLPRYSAIAGIKADYKRIHADFNARFTGSQKQTDFSTYMLTDVSPFVIYNAKVSVDVTPALSVHFGINNITNKHYAYTLGYPMPGRAYYAGLDYSF